MKELRKDLWTLFPYARHAIFPYRPPKPTEWSTELDDPDVGTIRISGNLREHAGAREAYVLVHGLGGSPNSYYCLRAAEVVATFGGTSLCLSLRGSDRRGEDFYNIALRADIEAAVASPELAKYERIFVVGYSMGGYVAMHYARGPVDERVKAVATLCPPIDLLTAQQYIDSPRAKIYRKHVLSGLISIYEAVAARGRPVPSDVREVRQVKTIYEWDRLTIAPRYGFESPEDYYEKLSIKPHLGNFEVPTLLIGGKRDPIIPPETIEPFLSARNEPTRCPLELVWIEGGGHVTFPRNLNLGFGERNGVEPQLYEWLLQHR